MLKISCSLLLLVLSFSANADTQDFINGNSPPQKIIVDYKNNRINVLDFAGRYISTGFSCNPFKVDYAYIIYKNQKKVWLTETSRQHLKKDVEYMDKVDKMFCKNIPWNE